jgi:pimeloyl-ACP methyl ester carboxylesterase
MSMTSESVSTGCSRDARCRFTIKAQIVADSLSSAPGAARTEWPLHGIAEDISADTQMVNVPALLVAGENDHVESVEVLSRNLVPYFSGADFVVIPNTGHLIPLEAPAELVQAMSSFAPLTE